MKVFVMFLALLIVCLSLLCFTADMDRYAKLQLHLKALAEECAAGSVLFTDPAAYSMGSIVFSEEDARSYVDFLLERLQEGGGWLPGGRLSASIRLFDEEKGYEGIQYLGIAEKRPCAAVLVCWEGPDIFRLPFFKLVSARRLAVYRWEH